MPVAQFFSHSKDSDDIGAGADWRKYLSNFAPVPVEVDGEVFPSAEHAFQAAKYKCSTAPDLARAFLRGGAVGALAPVEAKRAGGKGGMKLRGAVLDQKAWLAKRDATMRKILEARARSDARFRAILSRTDELNIYLLHFERQGAKAYWGGCGGTGSDPVKGANRLGELMMDVRRRLARSAPAGADEF